MNKAVAPLSSPVKERAKLVVGTADDGPEVLGPVALHCTAVPAEQHNSHWQLTLCSLLQAQQEKEAGSPEVGQRSHREELEVADPHDRVVPLHPVAGVQHGVLIHEVLGPYSQSPHKAE